MASPSDDLPALEPDPLLFRLTHLAAAAADAEPGSAARGRKGRKRGRAALAEQPSDEEDDDDDDDDEDDDDDASSDGVMADGANASAASAAAAAAAGQPATPAAADFDDDDDAPRHSPVSRIQRPVKVADVNGVARAMFPVVQTVHCSAWLGREIDVRGVARRSINAAFKPPGSVRFTFRDPSATVVLYTSGKYVCLGGKSTVDAVEIARKTARKVQRLPGYHDVQFQKFSLNNISANGAFGYRLNLRAISDDPAFADYVEYEPEQWKGLHYRLPVDPTKTLADLLPTYAARAAERARRSKEQWSTDEFLQQGKHAQQDERGLAYYATTGTGAGSRSKLTVGKEPAPLRLPPSLHGQILTATIYSNGRLTLTGVRREKDVHDAFLRLFLILQPFATTVPPDAPPQRPQYPRAFLPHQRKIMKREAPDYAPPPDVKPVHLVPQAAAPPAMLQLLRPSMPLVGTMAVKPEPGTSAAAAPLAPASDVAAAAMADASPSIGVKAEGGVKTEDGGTTVKAEPHTNGAGATADSAIVLDGLPDEPHAPAADDDDVEWE